MVYIRYTYQKWVNPKFCSLQSIQQVNLHFPSLQWILQSTVVHGEANLYQCIYKQEPWHNSCVYIHMVTVTYTASIVDNTWWLAGAHTCIMCSQKLMSTAKLLR